MTPKCPFAEAAWSTDPMYFETSVQYLVSEVSAIR